MILFQIIIPKSRKDITFGIFAWGQKCLSIIELSGDRLIEHFDHMATMYSRIKSGCVLGVI